MTAHWGIADPQRVGGTDASKNTFAFPQGSPETRLPIKLFTEPADDRSIGSLTLKEVQAIGKSRFRL